MGKRVSITIEVNVFDEKLLTEFATEYGRESGMEPDWAPADIAEALQMILDSGPGDLVPCDAGFEIEHSSAEELDI